MLQDITYMWNLKSIINQCIQSTGNRFTDTENKLAVISGEKKSGRGKMGNGTEIQTTMNKTDKQ